MNSELEHRPKPNLLLPVYTALCVVMYHGMIIAADTLSSLRWLMYARFAPLAIFAIVLVQEWPARRSGESSEVDSAPGRVQLLTAFLLAVAPFESLAQIQDDRVIFLAVAVIGNVILFVFAALRRLDAKTADIALIPVCLSTMIAAFSSILFYSYGTLLAMSI